MGQRTRTSYRGNQGILSFDPTVEHVINTYEQVAIRERIQKDSDAFDRQLDTSRSVQRRLVNLTSNVDGLQTELEDSEVG